LKPDDRNSIPELIEVLMRVVASNEPQTHEVRLDLRVYRAEVVSEEGLEFVVELDRAVFGLDLDGLDVVPKSRFGEPTKPNDVSIEHHLSRESSVQGEVGASLDGAVSANPTGGASLKLSGSASGKQTHSSSAQLTERKLRVKARGNLKWEITEPHPAAGLSPLHDTYLNDEVVCKITAQKGANRLAVRVATSARKADIRLSMKKNKSPLSFRSTNHEKMLKRRIRY
jgi:hypothetical protein